jgi:3-methyladenine DNA glycosylase AlkC
MARAPRRGSKDGARPTSNATKAAKEAATTAERASMSADRRGYSSIASIPRDVRERLDAAVESTRTLSEALAIDVGAYLRAIDPGVSVDAAMACTDAGGITRALALAARTMLDLRGPACVDTLAAHPTDTARGIAAFALALHAQEHAWTLERTLQRVRPLADDAHFGVREWAWLGVRPIVAAAFEADASEAVRAFVPWSSDGSERVRRFASEATRPRGVWCAWIGALRRAPAVALPILEPLHADPSVYVQDSVGNWLNDASKDDAAFVRGVCARWSARNGAHDGARGEAAASATKRIVTRALRTIGA